MTENRRIVEALRQSEEKFSRAFHGSPDSITISRLEDGVLLEVNQGFTEVYGYRGTRSSAGPASRATWVSG